MRAGRGRDRFSPAFRPQEPWSLAGAAGPFKSPRGPAAVDSDDFPGKAPNRPPPPIKKTVDPPGYLFVCFAIPPGTPGSAVLPALVGRCGPVPAPLWKDRNPIFPKRCWAIPAAPARQHGRRRCRPLHQSPRNPRERGFASAARSACMADRGWSSTSLASEVPKAPGSPVWRFWRRASAAMRRPAGLPPQPDERARQRAGRTQAVTDFKRTGAGCTRRLGVADLRDCRI
eukprot:gene15029-biopygen14232